MIKRIDCESMRCGFESRRTPHLSLNRDEVASAKKLPIN